MTVVKIYPLLGTMIFENILKYAIASGFNVINAESAKIDRDIDGKLTDRGACYVQFEVSQILTATQQAAIKAVFSGTAYITFS